MVKSVALAADASRPASLLLGYILQYAPSSRLASRAPRPRSSTDLAIRGPLLAAPAATSLDSEALERARSDVARGFNWSVGTSLAVGQALVKVWKNGWPLDSLEKLPARILAVQQGDVTRLVDHCRANAVVSALGDGTRIRKAWERASP